MTLPFDWCNIDNINSIKETLDNNFSNFFDYELKSQSMNFDNVNDVNDVKIKSLKRIITKNKIIFPHEAINDYVDEDLYKEKYLRRIKRFTELVQNKNIFKIFVRCDNKKISENKKKDMIDSLNKFGAQNYNIKFISYDTYKITGTFDWHRLYIDWECVFKI